MVEKLRRNWVKLGKRYTTDVKSLESIWDQIEVNYTEKKRYYHGLSHLNYMIDLTEENSDLLQDKDAVLFGVWFHDIVYKATKSDNEEESAVIAIKTLQSIGVDNEKIKKIKDLILSTDGHKIIVDTDEDNAYFLDFDLAVLGQDWSVYEAYIQNIRKESGFEVNDRVNITIYADTDLMRIAKAHQTHIMDETLCTHFEIEPIEKAESNHIDIQFDGLNAKLDISKNTQ